ncbi:MAG: hypothetical protein A3F35_01730 [Candidatus Woykebacteria bacterium RIFCSPHIGHO2_12_FULL_45_10]|uniref:Uncharacterized protein n=1 Tax=Candidatus Woykebacteria bacterium RIFCSPHIGHO2_12_FULL_45_10 TaxID=1802603 RepID=A0A1G1WRP5_9BACT|nr:MAG: hypothetical protein A3F35_01730 [Candidatus Woykebacteria bacterium RIFCSPHIGHO2_12_FULL_45_10]
MPKIKIKSQQNNLGWHFKVVLESEGYFEFNVTMDKDFYSRLSTRVEPDIVIEKCFEALLSREPLQKILPEFDIATVERYFPNIMGEIQQKLALTAEEA